MMLHRGRIDNDIETDRVCVCCCVNTRATGFVPRRSFEHPIIALSSNALFPPSSHLDIPSVYSREQSNDDNDQSTIAIHKRRSRHEETFFFATIVAKLCSTSDSSSDGDEVGLPLLTHARTSQAHVWLKAVYYFHVRDHVVLARELLETNRTRIVFYVRLVGGNVVATKVAYVCVCTMTNGASVNVALLHAKIANRTLGSLALDFEASLEVTLTDLRLAGDQIKYGTAQVILRSLVIGLGVRILLIVRRRCRRRGCVTRC